MTDFVNIGRDDAVAYATVILALAAIGALVANVFLAELTRRSMVIIRDQLRDDRRRAVPVLSVAWPAPSEANFVGNVRYVGGSEPALDVSFLLRIGDRFWYGDCDTIYSSAKESAYIVEPTDESKIGSMPVPTNPFKSEVESDAALVVMWRGSITDRLYVGRRYRLDEGRGYVGEGTIIRNDRDIGSA